jgi:hypothetical protein
MVNMNEYSVEIFPALPTVQTVGVGVTHRDFPDEKSAQAYRRLLVENDEAQDYNIRIVKL